MYKAIIQVVENYEYYKNAFHVFDYSSNPINNMKSTSNNVFEEFIKLKFNLKELSEEERVALKIYTFGNWAYGIEWTKNGMLIKPEKLAQYYVDSMPIILKKYID